MSKSSVNQLHFTLASDSKLRPLTISGNPPTPGGTSSFQLLILNSSQLVVHAAFPWITPHSARNTKRNWLESEPFQKCGPCEDECRVLNGRNVYSEWQSSSKRNQCALSFVRAVWNVPRANGKCVWWGKGLERYVDWSLSSLVPR